MSVESIHKICREQKYWEISKTNIIKRFTFPDEKVPWSVEYPTYKPVKFAKMDYICSPPECNSKDLKRGFHDTIFNARDIEGINRLSHLGPYKINKEGFPLNPRGRTGLNDRGVLKRWGPNQEVAPVLTRWARKGNKPGDPPERVDKKEDVDEVKEEKLEKELPTSLEGVWSPKEGGTQTVLISDKLQNDADPPQYAAINNEKSEFWAHLWVTEKTKIKLRDIGNEEFTGVLSLDKETNKVKIDWSDDDVWTLIESEWDIESENGEKKEGEVLTRKGKPILEVVMQQSFDGSGWTLCSRSLKPGEEVNSASRSVFGEELIDYGEMSDEQKQNTKADVENFFSCEVCLFKGYVDDPRNTDNSWVETVAFNFHDDTGKTVEVLKLNPEYKPSEPHWRRLYGDRKLLASQRSLFEEVVRLHGAFF